MPIEAASQTVEGHVYILYGNDDINVGAGVTIRSTTTDAITTWDGTHKFTVSGTIQAWDDGINTIGTSTAQTVEVSATGRIETDNDGAIVDADGVILDGIGSTLTNAGMIVAKGSGASLFVRDAGTTTVTNAGSMFGIVAGVWNKFGSGTLNFTNTGIVESPNFAFKGGLGTDNVTNMGVLKGTVDLGEGNDLYDGRGGTVQGSILGGNGDDRFIMGNGAETVDGGFGNDTVDFSGLTYAVAVNLATVGKNAGAAAIGDVYTNVETLIGTKYRDVLTGDAMNNKLIGGAHVDVLIGGAGDDTLVGGTAKDRLTGGAGGDVFVFEARTEGGDRIFDFDALADHIALEGSAFGYGTFAGAVAAADFVISTIAAAQDATDRFIYRTTDNTLWFDADGTGAGAALMLADLQAGAVLTADQLLII
jgi:Ca2+-binding RTX toxin-like protein